MGKQTKRYFMPPFLSLASHLLIKNRIVQSEKKFTFSRKEVFYENIR